MPQFPPVVAIFGPTGTGKTGAAVEIALRYNGEIINADSRYMYRDLQIGVAKPTLEERKGVRHHLLDIYDPSEIITLAGVQARAYAALAEITVSGSLPILVGGTPLYMNAITEGWAVPEVAPDWDFRAAMEAQAEEHGVSWLADQVREVDPVSAERSTGNARRLIRALEVHRATGSAMSDLESKSPPPYQFLNIGLTQPREILYPCLDERIDRQLATGWVEEVRGLLDSGLTGAEPGFTSIGYRQIVAYLNGEIDLAQAASEIRHATHRYVRHQSTWLRRKTNLIAIDSSCENWLEEISRQVSAFLAQMSTSEP